MRVFIAIEFPEYMKEYLNQIQQNISKYSKSGNFTKKENFHLTIRFIGEIEPNEVEKLKIAIDKTLLHQNSFKLYFNNLGRFLKGSKSIVWVGIKPNNMLNQLYFNLEKELEAQGYPKEERGFVPHVTLGREVMLTEEFSRIKETIRVDEEAVDVCSISLMESTRINGKLTYIPIYIKQFNISTR